MPPIVFPLEFGAECDTVDPSLEERYKARVP